MRVGAHLCATARVGYDLVQSGFGPGAPGALQVVTPTAEVAQTRQVLTHSSGIAQVTPAMPSADGRWQMFQAVPTVDPSSKTLGQIVDQLRISLPSGVLVGGAAAENHDLETLLAARTPLVIGVVLGLGFLLLLVALPAVAPLIVH